MAMGFLVNIILLLKCDFIMRRSVILCFISHYLPSYRSGGPVRTISNFVDHLGDEFDIQIVTRDRDALDKKPFQNVKLNAWNNVGKAKVFYATERTLTLQGLSKLMRDTPHDVLYLNSFFAFSFSILPLLIRHLRLAPIRPCVIAPRGEFSPGALEFKSVKKRLYLYVVGLTRFYNGLLWQASSKFEASDIFRQMNGTANSIFIAPNLPTKPQNKAFVQQARVSGPLRIIFLSRISPKKNLDFLLQVLAKVIHKVDLVIYGPIEDEYYWSICNLLIEQLPVNVEVRYLGEVKPHQVNHVFAASDLFVFPTRGENFGHVILESLIAGTPVLVSDQTPWQRDNVNGITTLQLGDPAHWAKEIDRWSRLDEVSLQNSRHAAKAVAQKTLNNEEIVRANTNLFKKAAGLL